MKEIRKKYDFNIEGIFNIKEVEILNEETLIKMLKSKEIEGLNMAIDKYSNLVFKVAYSVLNNKELSEEVINDVFLKMWNNIEQFEGDENKFKNWLCTISKYTAIDKLRKEKRHNNHSEINDCYAGESELIEEKLEFIEDLRKIKNEINKMKKIDREILIRRFYYDQSIVEIAKIFEMTQNAVQLRIMRKREVLNKIIKKERNL